MYGCARERVATWLAQGRYRRGQRAFGLGQIVPGLHISCVHSFNVLQAPSYLSAKPGPHPPLRRLSVRGRSERIRGYRALVGKLNDEVKTLTTAAILQADPLELDYRSNHGGLPLYDSVAAGDEPSLINDIRVRSAGDGFSQRIAPPLSPRYQLFARLARAGSHLDR